MQFLVKFIGPRDGWIDNMTEKQAGILAENADWIDRLIEEGTIIMTGRGSEPDHGLVILEAESQAEAVKLLNKEPSVSQGLHKYELHPVEITTPTPEPFPGKCVEQPTDRILRKEVTVPASLEAVWRAWTTNEGVRSFFSENAEVELAIGGPYEIYFDMTADYGSRGSEGCRVLSYLPMEMLSFEWNAPPSFGDLRGIHTRVVMQFEQEASGGTRVVLSHVGWGEGEKWDGLYDYFDKAWSFVLGNFEDYIKGADKE